MSTFNTFFTTKLIARKKDTQVSLKLTQELEKDLQQLFSSRVYIKTSKK